MKKVSFLFFLCLAGILAISLAAGAGDKKKDLRNDVKAPEVDWEIPMAAGVWYPGSGPVPEKPMRYYRVRCFPGCHVGSKYGAFPNTPLKGDRPIFPTSTIDNIKGSKSKQKIPKK